MCDVEEGEYAEYLLYVQEARARASAKRERSRDSSPARWARPTPPVPAEA